MPLAELCVLASFVVLLVYTYYRRTYGYWKNKGVPYAEPEHFFFGSSFDIICSRTTPTAALQKIYDSFSRESFCGFYHLTRPRLLIRDPELVEIITVKDFSHFYNRYLHVDSELDPLSAHLVNLRDEQWKAIRNKLTPVFSSRKLKDMHSQVLECADNLIEHFSAKESSPVEISDLVRRFGTDAICACAFGIRSDSMRNSSSRIFRIVRLIFKPSRLKVFRRFLRSEFSTFFNFIKWKNVPIQLENNFKRIIDNALESREKREFQRVDFLQMMNDLARKDLQLISNGQISKNDPNVFSEKLMYANAFVFLLAGFETTTLTICYALYELALNPGIQEATFQEVKRVTTNHESRLTYDAIKEMTFLAQVLSESLRRYPPVPITNREVTKDYKLPGTNVILRKGMEVVIPIHSIHHDPLYFPEPFKFKPERFSQEAKSKMTTGTYLPFGEGPRKCIGIRFAELQAKVTLSRILLEFRVIPCDKTRVPLLWEEKSPFFATPKGGIWIKFERRSKQTLN